MLTYLEGQMKDAPTFIPQQRDHALVFSKLSKSPVVSEGTCLDDIWYESVTFRPKFNVPFLVSLVKETLPNLERKSL